MRSFRDSSGISAVAVERRDRSPDDEAEVIDLVHLPPGTRPTPFASIEIEEVNRCRVLDCSTYSACLSFAARLLWPSFHCRQGPKYDFDNAVNRSYERAVLRGGSGPDAAVIKLR